MEQANQRNQQHSFFIGLEPAKLYTHHNFSPSRASTNHEVVA